MPVYHEVQQGEHLSGIAHQYGFTSYEPIWNHSENAALKLKRGDPHILLPGDALFIPDFESAQKSATTDQRHEYRLRGKQLILRLVLKNTDDKPLANLPCSLTLDGSSEQTTTDGEGLIERMIPRSAKEAAITASDPATGLELKWNIRIGHLDPAEEITGVMARLNNLGYFAGEPGGKEAEAFQMALEEFQCDQSLKVSGQVDSATLAKLKEVHGS